jgi:thiol-disulfide isomerase/thioredoxin
VTTSLIAAGLTIVGVLSVINLVVSYGVVRRLREHEQRFAEGFGGGQPGNLVLPVGEKVAGFTAADLAGDPVSLATLEGPTLVGFFSASCEPCCEVIPGFIATAAEWPGGARGVLAVVTDDSGSSYEDYLASLGKVATVVGAGEAEPVSTAFGLKGVPGICVVESDGTVSAEGKRVLTAVRPM